MTGRLERVVVGVNQSIHLVEPRARISYDAAAMPIILLVALFADFALLVKFGRVFGGAWLLIEILATAGLGYWLIRRAGRRMLRTNELIAVMANPAEYFRRSGWPLILAGLLLIVPGILSDGLGLILFIRALALRRQGGTSEPSHQRTSTDDDIIDVEYEVREEDDT